MWAIRAILIALVVICIVGFGLHNVNPEQKVDVDLVYVKYIGVPLVTVVFWSFLGGVLVAVILFVSKYIKLSVQLRSTYRKIQALESEVTVLRNRPIEESADLLKGADGTKRNEELLFPES